MRALIFSCVTAVALAGCANTDGSAVRFGEARNSTTELELTTQRPLVFPDTFALPVPTPGGTNLADGEPRSGTARALRDTPTVAVTE